MNFTDVHIHLANCTSFDFPENYAFCSSSHSVEEFHRQREVADRFGLEGKFSFGLHPLLNITDRESFELLEKLLSSGEIDAVGECGHDFFSDRQRETERIQDEAFSFSVECASRYSKPLVVHNVKAMDKIFAFRDGLKKVPAVVFHSFCYTEKEVDAVLKKGINAYFSFGKGIFRGGKKISGCIRACPRDRLLLETDAPYQKLKGEQETVPLDITKVYEYAAGLLGMDCENLSRMIGCNFRSVFSSS